MRTKKRIKLELKNNSKKNNFIKFKEFFKKYEINKNNKIVLWISGGADSIFMLMACIDLFKENCKSNLIIAHINHNLRWKESDLDELLVKKLADKYNIKYKILSINILEEKEKCKKWIEETARNVRYNFFEKLRKENNADYIFTAHHLDDKLETMMFNLIRWTTLNWITSLKSNYNLIYRPCINYKKEELENYLVKNNIEYRVDQSNFDTKYLRNKIRQDILPGFSSINPEYQKALNNFIEYSETLKDFINKNIINFLDKFIVLEKNTLINTKYFNKQEFLNLDIFLQKEIIRYLYEISNFGTIWLSKGLINELVKFITNSNSHWIKNIKNLKLEKKWNKIYY